MIFDTQSLFQYSYTQLLAKSSRALLRVSTIDNETIPEHIRPQLETWIEISPQSIRDLEMSNTDISFRACFNDKVYSIVVPYEDMIEIGTDWTSESIKFRRPAIKRTSVVNGLASPEQTQMNIDRLMNIKNVEKMISYLKLVEDKYNE